MMSSFSLGDLAQTFMLQRRGAALKENMTRLTEELSTGQVSDVKSVLSGNVSYLTDIEQDLKTLSGYRVAATEAGQFADAVQSALERVDASIGTLGTSLLTMSSSAVEPVVDQLSTDAEAELASVVSALNTNVGGRSVFAGRATDQRALVSADAILDGLRIAITGATTPQDIQAAADLWFSDPGGFSAVAYGGSTSDIAPLRLAKDETVSVQVKADDAAFRNILKGLAVAAVTSDTNLALTAVDKRELLTESGRAIFESQAELIAVRANIGSAQARIDEIATRSAAEETSLQYAKGALLQADPYETATELEAVQFQLQSLYAVTARTSELSFLNFIR
jgi:flagellar hook-associated protein 3 FlgL